MILILIGSLVNHILRSSETIYALGTMSKVKMVEEVRPPITVIAKGLQRLEPSSVPAAMGNNPKSVVMVVIRIGLSLSLEAMIMALRYFIFFFRN